MKPTEGLDLLQQIAEYIPFNHVVGLELVSVTADGASMAVDNRPELANNPRSGVLHGGVISSLLDTVGGFSALSALVFEKGLDTLESVVGAFEQFGTVDLRIDYLRPGIGDRFVGTGKVMRSGRRIAVTRMELVNEVGVLLATGTGTYVTG